MGDKITVAITIDPTDGVTIQHNLKHPIDAARALSAALNVILAPQQAPQSRIVQPHPSGLVVVGGGNGNH